MIEFVKEITNYGKSGITEQELAFVKSSLGQSDALRYETSLQKAFFLNRIIEYNLPRNYVEQQSDILRKITKAEIDAVAKKQLPVNNMIITVVGDKKLVRPGLAKLGYELIELDKEGDPIAAAAIPTEGAAPAKASGGKKD